MDIINFAKEIFYSQDIESKLIDPSIVDSLEGQADLEKLSELSPGRASSVKFSDEQIKFPRKRSLHLDDKKGLALHFFANHELLAIEMMAAAILFLPTSSEWTKRIRSGLLTTIRDEQKHFKMYVNRMDEYSVGFGDFPLNDYFWRQMQKVETIEQYLMVMALTFEAANLDFAKYYKGIFEEVGDEKTAKILNVVYEDEITHVAFGATWLNKWKSDLSLWNYYKEGLPDLLTPARAKGIIFDREGRERAGLDKDFIEQMLNYRDPFVVTNRKEWT